LTPRALLARRVAHRRLSLFAVIEAAVAACVAVALARAGFGIWALLSVDAVRAVLALFVFYAWRPVWKPRLLWSRSRVRYYLRFGSRNVVGQLLEAALRRLDKLWLGLAADPVALGLYSRAARFARVPGALVGGPLVSVSGGAFAELEDDRPRSSRAFFQAAALSVRGSFLVAGTLALVAPEFVGILLGERWLPMLASFRILLAAFPLALVTRTLAQLFLARGRPETVVRVRGTQVAVLAAGLAVLTPGLGRDGAALAVVAATLVGLGLSLRFAREHVDFSARRLFLAPVVALAVALPLGAWSAGILPPATSDWALAAVEAVACAALYVAVLWALERRELARAIATVLRESPR
jgi:O-antigen/teichoic acid export membrane protein